MGSRCIDSSRPQRLQSEATPLVEPQRIQVIICGGQPKYFKPVQPIYNRLKKCRPNSLMANEDIDRYQFSYRPVSARHGSQSFQIASDKDIARIDRIELRPHDDRIAPYSGEYIDGDRALTLIRWSDLHETLLREDRIQLGIQARIRECILTHRQ